MSLRKVLFAATTLAALNETYTLCENHPNATGKTRRRWERAYDAKVAELTATKKVAAATRKRAAVVPASKTVTVPKVSKTVAKRKPATRKKVTASEVAVS